MTFSFSRKRDSQSSSPIVLECISRKLSLFAHVFTFFMQNSGRRGRRISFPPFCFSCFFILIAPTHPPACMNASLLFPLLPLSPSLSTEDCFHFFHAKQWAAWAFSSLPLSFFFFFKKRRRRRIPLPLSFLFFSFFKRRRRRRRRKKREKSRPPRPRFWRKKVK